MVSSVAKPVRSATSKPPPAQKAMQPGSQTASARCDAGRWPASGCGPLCRGCRSSQSVASARCQIGHSPSNIGVSRAGRIVLMAGRALCAFSGGGVALCYEIYPNQFRQLGVSTEPCNYPPAYRFSRHRIDGQADGDPPAGCRLYADRLEPQPRQGRGVGRQGRCRRRDASRCGGDGGYRHQHAGSRPYRG